MTLRIAIAGAAGRMGLALAKAAGDDMTIVGGSERAGSPAIGQDFGGWTISDGTAKAAANADVWIDFTTPDASLAALEQLKLTKVKAAIVGTTGLSPQQEQQIADHARRIAIVRDRNFSLGVNLMIGLVEQVAERLGPEWDVEIFEAHHKRKVDAPSGTALMIGEAAAKGRGAKLTDLRAPPNDGLTGPRKPGSIGFAVSRSGGIIGDHEISFGTDEEILTIGHRALDRALFARGAIAAAKWAADRPPGLYRMRDVLAL
ncbi:MAG TPA: 4-hydroxy-tetrahydrodipicolinate reductase [Hyphomonadaceae bacterium]|nr:4-hydroxy-tetrahydrodipicolinate reductase [Hyphomonadaceae bacterium]